MNTVTRALLSAMRATALDAEAFAALVEVEPADVRAWEAGARNAPSAVLIRCARALAVTVEDILSDGARDAAVPSLLLLRRPHVETHDEDHPDLPPARHGIREGALLDEAAAALAEGRIDRVEAHRLLDLPLTEPLPPHARLTDEQRAPLRSVEEDARSVVRARLARSGRGALRAADVLRSDDGWRVRVVDPSGAAIGEELLSFDLDAERAAPSA